MWCSVGELSWNYVAEVEAFREPFLLAKSIQVQEYRKQVYKIVSDAAALHSNLDMSKCPKESSVLVRIEW